MERRPAFASALLVAVWIAGCAGTPVQRQEATAQSLIELRDAIKATRGQVEGTLASLIRLMNAPAEDLREAYRRYSDDVDAIARQAVRIETESRQVRQRADAWLSAWKESYPQVADPELRTLTEKRREQVLKRFDALEGSLIAAREAFVPFIVSLQDVQQVVGNDLSPRGVTAVSGTAVVRNATDSGAAAARALDVTLADLEALIEALTAAP